MIRTTSLEAVRHALSSRGAVLQLKRPAQGTVVCGVVYGEQPVPKLLKYLFSSHDLGPEDVGPNHVFWPQGRLEGLPWYSGGAECLPVEVPEPLPELIDSSNSRGQGVTIAVFDSGLLPDYANGSEGRDWLTLVTPARGDLSRDVEGVDGDPDNPYFLDFFDSHATFIAGVIKRVAPNASVVVRNVLEESGEVADDTLSDEIRDLLLGDGSVKLVNLSLGGTISDPLSVTGLASVVAEFPEVVFVAAAGNNGAIGNDPIFPAGLGSVVGVGALTADASGPAAFSNTNSVDVWAVGQDVISAFGRGTLAVPGRQQVHTTGMATWSGTSFSAPLVTAVLCDYVTGNVAGPPDAIAADAINWLRLRYPPTASNDRIEVRE